MSVFISLKVLTPAMFLC